MTTADRGPVTLSQNQEVDAVGADLDNGFIDIYDGILPADNDAPTGVILVSCALGADAYAGAEDGVAQKNGTIQGEAVADGVARYAQQRNAENTRWMYGPVSEKGGGGVIQLHTIAIKTGDKVTINGSRIKFKADGFEGYWR